MQRKLQSILLVVVLLMTSMAATCKKSELFTYADDVLSSLKAAQPLIAQFLPTANASITQGLDIAQKLKDAITSSTATNAVGYLEDLIPIFQGIVRDDIPQLHDPNLRTEIMAALALADIGLHFLVNHLQKSSAPEMMAAKANAKANTIAAFAKEPVWGERYRAKK